MNRIVYYIALLILTGLLSFFMFLSSFSFAESDSVPLQRTEENKWYQIGLNGTTDNATLHYSPVSEKFRKIQPNTVIFGEIGRLSSIMYLSQSGTVFPPIGSGGTATGIILENIEGIVSLYDLFSTYTLTSADGEFRLEQITNGSFYIGKEADGKIAIYAIDGVIRLVFLDKGTEMTNMILFPGSYIRFDPKRNAALKGADLFRTILSLQDGENEVFEFVNPRVNAGNEKDTFFNYRLPLETKTLFRILSARFHNQVEGVDLLKSYSSDDSTPTIQASEWMLNPSKRNHLMLLELKSLLSQIVTMRGTATSSVDRIAEIYRDATSLKMESSTAKKTIEQFLLDGRFALYGSNISEIGKGYQDNYEKIAQMIGITPSSGKSKLLQSLADIYSGNLFLQTSKNSTFTIDTFRPTASTLLTTVQTGGIDQKDYFDIALYAYNILDKVQDKGILSSEYIENKSTYDYLTTFFYAGSKYMNSIDDMDKRNKTISSFSSQFYEKILSMIVESLYHTFMKEDHGALFLGSSFADEKSVKIDIELLRYIYRLNGIISNVNDTIRSAYEGGADMDVYTKIQKETLRLNGLAILLDPEKRNENYRKYVEFPYVAEMENNVALPKVKDDLSGLELYVKPIEIVPVNTGGFADKKFDLARSLFPDADISSLIPEGSALRVNKASGYILKTDGTNADANWSLVINNDELISQIMLSYMGRSIEVKSQIPDIHIDTFKSFILGDLKAYLDIIDSNSDIPGGIRIFTNLKRIDIGDQTFVLPNT